VDVTYSLENLRHRGDVNGSTLTVPVFGLYAGFHNQGTVTLAFAEEATQTLSFEITTSAYADPLGIYDQPTILKARAPGTALGFDFFALKSTVEPVVVVDTDGEIRWVGAGMPSTAIVFRDGAFFIGSGASADFQRNELDGTLANSTVVDPTILDFHHNIDPGKDGLLIEVDTTTSFEATVEEIAPTGALLRRWDLAQLLAGYMSQQGDDPTAFVRPETDWFHLNASTYDPRDDSLIVSSRENFVIKIDYATGQPIWILGDPTKYWYTFPSLRAKALQLVGAGLVPIGQHATSITADGLLLLFNDGLQSLKQPPGQPAGDSRPYSAVSAYSIDAATMTAREVWDFDHGQTVRSIVCSSAYEAAAGSVLVDYAFASAGTAARILGLDASHQVVFEFVYRSEVGCSTAWNAVPVPLENLQLQ
jgi:hypothetical protein